MKLFLVSGFLGSGKTTAIREAAIYLQQQKKKVGVITNDQGTQQVDTRYIRSWNIPAEEVAGSCFCCNYDELEKCIDALADKEQPDVIFAESVGSCTDLTATIMNPLLQFHKERFDIVLSVFADVRLLCIYLQGNKDIFHGNVNYIFQKQLEEADLLVVNKFDLLNREQSELATQLITKEFGGKNILYQDSLSPAGIRAWVNAMCADRPSRSPHPAAEVDYDIYGAGEAELAWFDQEIDIFSGDNSANEAAIFFTKKIYQKIILSGHRIGHLKFFLDDGQESRKISFTSMDMHNDIDEVNEAAAAGRVNVLINARVQTSPDILAAVMAESIKELEATTGCKVIVNEAASFKPGYPRPTHRFS